MSHLAVGKQLCMTKATINGTLDHECEKLAYRRCHFRGCPEECCDDICRREHGGGLGRCGPREDDGTSFCLCFYKCGDV